MNRTSFLLIFSLIFGGLHATCYYEKSCEPWGADCDLTFGKAEKVKSYSFAQKAALSCIHFFQDYISPIDGPRSSFYPTSSQYALEAIERYGVLMGIALGCDRLLRENSEDWVYEIVNKYGVDRKYDPIR